MNKVSVIIPTYNRAQLVGRAIDSILAQTYTDFEIIVIDDGSTDETVNILDHYSDRIKYMKQVNQGVSNARNKGIVEAKGEYIAFLDADDMWKPEKLNRSLNFLENNGFDWICTNRQRVDENRATLKQDSYPTSSQFEKTGRIDKLEIGLFNLNFIWGITSTVILRRKCLDICGMFDETLKNCEDLDLLLRLQEAGFIGGFLNEPLTIKMSNPEGLTRKRPVGTLEYTIVVAKKHAKILHLDRPLRGRLYSLFWWEIALAYYLNGLTWDAFKYSLISLYYYPDLTKLIKIIKHSLASKTK